MQASSNATPVVTVIIPHLGNRPMLDSCLDSLRQSTYTDFTVLVVDNGGEDSDLDGIEDDRPEISVLRLSENAGYAGGCNAGLRHSFSPYVVFLNDDALVEPEWLGALCEAAEADPMIGALQPKILSLAGRRKGVRLFDYAGAAGGLLDRLGYPYCFGRSFQRCEIDDGQYDLSQELFWASGVALFARRHLLEELGGFEESFFIHMEEIDLCWRMKLAGYHIRSVPQSVVWHEGGASLSAGSPRKVYYNHRNALLMLLRNRSTVSLLMIFPFRLPLELMAIVFYLGGGSDGVARAAAVLRAYAAMLYALPETFRQRTMIQRMRTVTDRELFRGVPLSMFFLLRQR